MAMTISVGQPISNLEFAVGLAIATSVALAGPQPNRSFEPAVTVRFGDLNTSTAQGHSQRCMDAPELRHGLYPLASIGTHTNIGRSRSATA
jgi:hypothetical protein